MSSLLKRVEGFGFLLIFLLVGVKEVRAIECQEIDSFNETWAFQLKDRDILELLTEKAKRGAGAYGRIYEVPWRVSQTGPLQRVAVKKSRNYGEQNEMRREINFLDFARRKGFKYIPRLIDCLFTQEKYYIVMEYLEGSLEPYTVMKYSGEVKPNTFFFTNYYTKPVMERLRALRQIALALFELHGSRLVHHDVKPDNIMAADASLNELRLIDFSFLTANDGPSAFGTPRFNDLLKFYAKEALFVISEDDEPQALSEPEVENWKADIWAFGLSIFELEMPNSRKVFNLLTEVYPASKGYEMLQAKVLEEDWIGDRELTICHKKEGFCFRDILADMIAIDRARRLITAKEIARKLTLLIGDKKKFTFLFDEPTDNVGLGSTLFSKLSSVTSFFGSSKTSTNTKLAI